MNTTSKTMKAICFAVAFALVSSAAAAQAWKTPKLFRLDNTWPFRDKDKPQEGTPVRMVGAWTDTVMTQAGQKPLRGFGGRIMFYDKEGKKPILVEGQLVVYAFDEAGRDPTDNKPTRRYVFPADQMPIHMSKSELGASYSFWLPWDEAGGPKTEVSLICRFEPKGGAVVTGEQTKHLLPGPVAVASAGSKKPPNVPEGVPSKPPRQTLEDMQAKRNAEQQARLTSFEAPAAGAQQGAVANASLQMGATPERHLTAATIPLPQSYQLPDAACAEFGDAGRRLPAGSADSVKQHGGTGDESTGGSRAALHGDSTTSATVTGWFASNVPRCASRCPVARWFEFNDWSSAAAGVSTTGRSTTDDAAAANSATATGSALVAASAKSGWINRDD